MCDPMSIVAVASAAASAGGAYMNSSSQASNQAAAINAKNAEAQRLAQQEAQLQQQSTGIFQNTLKPYQDSTQPDLPAAQAANTAVFNGNTPTAAMLGGGATTGDAPKVVQDSANASVASRLAKAGASNAAFGNLTGYDSLNNDRGRALKSAADNIGVLSDFGKQDANVSGALSQAAMVNSQKAPSPFGDILGAAGGLGSYYAGKNGAFANLFGGTPNFGAPGVFG